MRDDLARRDRMARLRELAAEQEERARADFLRADHEVDRVDRSRGDALLAAARLAQTEMPLRLRGHLANVGGRHLVQLADRRAELAVEADRCRNDLAEAVTRVRSFDRLVVRLERTVDEHRRRREAADLQDLVAIRAAREAR